MPKRDGALSPRSVILAAVAVLAVSMVWMIATILRPKDSGGLGRDSYGTRADGYRALYETIEELGVPVSRSISPPAETESIEHTYVLLAPNERLVKAGPKYLAALQSWVERGGRLVIVPSGQQASPMDAFIDESLEGTPEDVLDALDLEDLLELDPSADVAVEAADEMPAEWVNDEDYDFLPDELRQYWEHEQLQSFTLETRTDGAWNLLEDDVGRLALPVKELAELRGEPEDLSGWLIAIGDDREELLLAAAIERGEGEIVVVSESLIFSNHLLARGDNSILAARLLSPNFQPVVFDEFYHGLSVRGNPFYLLTYPGFATIVCTALLVIAVWAWRSAAFLGPPLAAVERSRRNIGEYIEAMAQFFSRGAGSRRFLVHELREGVLRELCRRLQLPLETPDEAKIIAKLGQRDQQRAERLTSSLAAVDGRLAGSDEYPKAAFLTDAQRLTACL
ncbi:MAG TPA: DUF4350 domain-containing protein [Lacipirellula sp.]